MTELQLAAAHDSMLAGIRTVKDVLAPDLTDQELQLFAMVAARSGLDPFAKQIYAVKRQGRVTFQTGIDGYRSIAARTGLYDGQDEPEWGPPCDCGRQPNPHPEYATVRAYRKGVSRSFPGQVWWHEYVPEPGQSGRGDQMWRRMPHVMLAKCAEAAALRKAFPYDPTSGSGIGADLYTAEEMAQAQDEPEAAGDGVRRTSSARAAVAARAEAARAEAAQVGQEAEAPLLADDGVPDAETAEPSDLAAVDRPDALDSLTMDEFTEWTAQERITTRKVAIGLEALGWGSEDPRKMVQSLDDEQRAQLRDRILAG